MNIQFIDHVVIIVKDIQKTYNFYKAFLGEPPEEPEKEQVWWKIGDTKIFFGLPYGDFQPYDKDKYGINHLAFGVRTIEELKELESKLNDANIKNSGIQIDKWGKKEFIWFDDPDEYRLEFYCRPVE